MKLYSYFIMILAVPVLAFGSCTKDRHEPGGNDDTTGDVPKEIYRDYGGYLMTDRTDIEEKPGIPDRGYWLDGKVTVRKMTGSSYFTTFWPSANSLMQSYCRTPWLEDNINNLTHGMVVIGKEKNPTPDFSDGGQWFIGVHELPDRSLVGFFHSESHWPGENCTYKSIGVAYSDDFGMTWTAGDKILSGNEPKPAVSANDGRSYGLGDGCVVWNEERQSWICYYSGYCPPPDGGDFMITMAESKDLEGRAGTWKKWDGSGFTVEGCDQSTGLGGINTSIKGLAQYHGGNPSVMYNTWLGKWIMVYHCWQRFIVISYSDDGIVWENTDVIISLDMEPGGSMYPNLIGPEGDVEGGQDIRIYYSTDMVDGIRTLSMRKISFK